MKQKVLDAILAILADKRADGEAILHCIVWEEARFVALYKGRYFRSKCFLKQDWLDEFEKEVIGNIHDNQELVQQ